MWWRNFAQKKQFASTYALSDSNKESRDSGSDEMVQCDSGGGRDRVRNNVRSTSCDRR